MAVMLGSLPVWAGDGLAVDEIIVRYPAGFTKVLAWDVAPFLMNPELGEGVLGPLMAANHPLAGIVRTIEFFRIPPQQVVYVAHGEGPEVTSFSVIAGPGLAPLMGALQGLQAAAQAPGSPFTHFELETIDGIPVAFVGGTFGPIAIEWAYIPTEGALWIGTEVAFQPGQPDVERLRATTRLMIDKLLGRRSAGAFSELHIAIQVRGGQLAFVRTSAPGERPQEEGEQAMGFRLEVRPEGVHGKFALRFESAGAARAAVERLRQGTSPYLAQDLYRAELLSVLQTGRTLNVTVDTDLRGLVGLLLLVMPF
jgi:hypothetical protein